MRFFCQMGSSRSKEESVEENIDVLRESSFKHHLRGRNESRVTCRRKLKNGPTSWVPTRRGRMAGGGKTVRARSERFKNYKECLVLKLHLCFLCFVLLFQEFVSRHLFFVSLCIFSFLFLSPVFSLLFYTNC